MCTFTIIPNSYSNFCVLFSTVLVLIFVVFSRRQESHMKYAGPDDDVRENIINYDDEGGGEDDMTAYDITPLQIPIAGGPLAAEHHGNRKLGSCKLHFCTIILSYKIRPIRICFFPV